MRIEIVEVSGEGCANCLTLLPVLRELASRRGMALRHIEAAPENRDKLEKWKIERVPTVLLTADGEPFARCTGYQPEEILEAWLDAMTEKLRERKA